MNIFYKGGRGLCLPDRNNQPNFICDIRRGETSFAQYIATFFNMRANIYLPLHILLIFVSLLFNNAALAQSRDILGAVNGVGEIKPLEIGDPIPNALWNAPLQVVNHPEGKKTITLGDYKDKLIILDFWATWCAPCIKSLDKLDTLQGQFTRDLIIIPVTYEDATKTLATLKKNQWLLQSVISDQILKEYFPHRSIPHQAWLHEGKVSQLLGGEYTNEKNIMSVIEGKEINVIAKIDTIKFDQKKPLLFDGNGGDPSRIAHQSLFTKSIPLRISGISNGKTATMIYNQSILNLLLFAHQDEIPLTGILNRIVWEVKDSLRGKIEPPFSRYGTGEPENELFIKQWKEEHMYCYNMIFPKGLDDEKRGQIIKEDITRFAFLKYNIKAKIEKRNIEHLELYVIDAAKLGEYATDDKDSKVIVRNGIYVIQNSPISLLINRLNDINMISGLPVVDGTNFKDNINLSINIEGLNEVSMNERLSQYGLGVKRKTGPIKMLVIKEA